LRTFPAIDREVNPKEDPNSPAEIVFDLPGPERDPSRLNSLRTPMCAHDHSGTAY
jgi:hypothetical protein